MVEARALCEKVSTLYAEAILIPGVTKIFNDTGAPGLLLSVTGTKICSDVAGSYTNLTNLTKHAAKVRAPIIATQ
jgi:hypothetical protein